MSMTFGPRHTPMVHKATVSNCECVVTLTFGFSNVPISASFTPATFIGST